MLSDQLECCQIKRHFIISFAWFEKENEAILFMVFEGETRLDKYIGSLPGQIADDNVRGSNGIVHTIMKRECTTFFRTHINQNKPNPMVPFDGCKAFPETAVNANSLY